MPRVRSHSRRRVTVGLLVLIAIGLIVADRRGALAGQTRRLAAHIFQPAQSLSRDAVMNLRDPNRTDVDDRQLAEQSFALAAQLAAEVEDLKRQIREMKEISHGLADYPLSLVPARVISRYYVPPPGGLDVGVGSKSGLRTGQFVVSSYISQGAEAGVARGQSIVNGKGLVGIVEQVGPSASQIRLVTSPDCTVAANIVHWDRRTRSWVTYANSGGVTVGTEDGRALYLKYISKSLEVAPGDYVITAPGEPGIAANLIIGQVAEVATRPTDLTHAIVVRPRVDLSALDQVYVLSVRGAPSRGK